MRKAKQSKNVRELNLLNNHCWYMDGNVLPGTQTHTNAHNLSINTTTTSRNRVAYLWCVTGGMVIWSNEKTKIFKEFVESCD